MGGLFGHCATNCGGGRVVAGDSQAALKCGDWVRCRLCGSVGGSHSGGARGNGCEVLSLWTSSGGCWAIGSPAMVDAVLLEVSETSSLMHVRGGQSFGELGAYGHKVGDAFWDTSKSYVGSHIRVVNGTT